ncbi:MAG: hypothetical protein IKN73_02000 [Alphaproteobacteria bacterium]|nr:hypothetical protein [Alphaproteobacteria bacterium]
MEKKKSDFQRFCETNWIMVKPWVITTLLVAIFGVGINKFISSESYKKLTQKIENINKSNSLQNVK